LKRAEEKEHLAELAVGMLIASDLDCTLDQVERITISKNQITLYPDVYLTYDRVYATFPLVYDRRSQLAGTLSGGEQQMVAIARGLMARPKLLMIDEPFLGLAPMVVQELGHLVRRIRDEQGITVIFIEQNVELALRLADRGYVLESGRTILNGPSADLLTSPEVRRIFLGDAAL
jgi:branched-chain amino acid transport system ATP-binding protein